MGLVQPFRVKPTSDGRLAMWPGRARLPRLFNPDQPAPVKRSVLTGVRARGTGTIPSDPEGSTAWRDTNLAPWYGQLQDPASPYYKTGPRVDQVGITVPYSSLTEANSASTNSTSLSGSTVRTFDKQIVHGRLLMSGQSQVIATNCVLDGPLDPTIATGETAIIDQNSMQAGAPVSVFIDCTIYMRAPHPRWNGHKGSNAIFIRCHIFWVTDGFGPYSNINVAPFPTNFKALGCRIERLVYWPGARGGRYYANRTPAYWNGSSYSQTISSSTYTRDANGTDLDRVGYFDDQHYDGTHNDCIEGHNGYGSHVFNPDTKMWEGDGVYICGNALIASDAYGMGNPSALPIPIPQLGYGDNPRRAPAGQGQLPGMERPPTSWTKSMARSGAPVDYPANGVALYIGHVNPSKLASSPNFGTPTSWVAHGNLIDGGNAGFQEQKKGASYIEFVFYGNLFGGRYYRWSSDNTRDIYVARINDRTTDNVMPDWVNGPVRIPVDPIQGLPPFGNSAASNRWVDAAEWGKADFEPVGLGSSSTPGIRVM